MSAKLKKLLNRAGLIAVIVGVVATVAGGGNASAVLEYGAMAASIGGTVMIFIRELLN